MENKVKAWVERELNDAIRNANIDCKETFSRCYGIMMFATNEMFNEYNENLVAWWDNEIYPRFTELVKERG